MAVHAPSLATVLRDPKTIGSALGAAAGLIPGGAARDAIQVFLGKLDALALANSRISSGVFAGVCIKDRTLHLVAILSCSLTRP